ncbi:MAG: glycosyltransferase family 2 protein [Actinomycetota bacterium]
MDEPKVALIIINYNGKPHLKECINSIKAQTYKNHQVIVIDNNSTDGSVEYIRGNFQDVELIENKKNIGFGKAINKVLKAKLKDRSISFFGILNNDVKFEKDWLKHLISYSRGNPKAGILSGKILLYHWPKYVNSTGVNINYFGYGWDRDFFELDRNTDTESGPVLAVTGSATLVKREVFEQVGLYDNDYFMYYEDSDLCFRVWKYTGFTVDYVKDAVVYHKFSASLGIFSTVKHFYLKRSRFIFILKNFPLSFVARIFPKITRYEFGDFMLPLMQRLDFINFFRELHVYLVFLLRFPFYVFKKLFLRRKAKKSGWWDMMHPSYTKSATKDLHPEYLDIIKPFEKYGSLTSRILMGISDKGLGEGWSGIVNSIPRGRYIFKQGDCTFSQPGKKGEEYFLQLHYRSDSKEGKKLNLAIGDYSVETSLRHGWNTELFKIPVEAIEGEKIRLILKLSGGRFEDLFVNEIALLSGKSNLLRL